MGYLRHPPTGSETPCSTTVVRSARLRGVARTRGISGVPAPLLVITAIACVQTGAAVARTLFDDLGVAGTALLRLVIAALVLLAVVRPAVTTWSRRQWAAAGLLGCALAGMNLVFYSSLDLVPLGVAVTVEFLGPLLLALVQTRRVVDFLWVALAGGGVALLGLQAIGGVVDPLGLVLAFTAGLFWAGYIVSSARVGRVLPGVDGLAVALVVAALLVLPFGAKQADAVVAEPSLLAGVALVALLSTIIPYGLEMTALRRIPTRVFGVLMSLQPAAAAVSGWLILDQVLGVTQVTALFMVVCASAGVTLTRRAPAVTPDLT
jgi:inner membrane transporter RhtA